MTVFDPQDGGPLALFVARQVEAIDSWNAARQDRESALQTQRTSRRAGVIVARRLDALQRTHQAVLSRCAEFLARDPGPLAVRTDVRAVVAHRHEWLADTLSDALARRGVHVVAATGNGADALGLTIAEQPEVIVVGTALEMMTGAELLAEAALFAPRARRVALVPYTEDVAVMFDAGAHSVYTRQVPPETVAEEVAELLVEQARSGF